MSTSGSTNPWSRHAPPIFCLLLVALVAILTFANAIEGTFHHDDHYGLVQNPAVRSLNEIPRYFRDPTSLTTLVPNADYRPLLQVTYAASYALGRAFGDPGRAVHSGNPERGPDPGYDARYWLGLSVGLHALASVFAFLLARTLLAALGERGASGRCTALGAGLIFAVHPLATEPVDYLWARSSLLVTMFTLASLWAYVEARAASAGWRGTAAWYFLCLIAFAAACFTKVSAVILPAFVVLVEVVLGGRRRRSWLGVCSRLVPLVGLAIGYYLFYETILPSHVAEERHGEITGLDYLWIQSRAWFHYLGSFVYPFQLSADTDFASFGISGAPWPVGEDLTTTFALLGAALLGLVALATWRRAPLVTLAVGWFFLGIAPTSSVMALAEPVNDHRPYIVLFPLTLLTAWGVTRLWKLLLGRMWSLGATVTTLALVVSFARVTHERNAVWRTELSLWADVVEKHPFHAKAHMNLGFALREEVARLRARGDVEKADDAFERAGQHFQRTVELAPHYDFGLTNWAIHLRQLGRLVEARRFHDLAVAQRRGTVWSVEHLIHRAEFLSGVGALDGAIADLEEALALQERDDVRERLAALEARRAGAVATAGPEEVSDESQDNVMGQELVREGRLSEALAHFDAAAARYEEEAWPLHNGGWVCDRLNDLEGAARRYAGALERDPLFFESQVNLGYVYRKQGRDEEARASFAGVPRGHPSYAAAQQALAEMR
ncbi:MAG: hypothetical protein H6834_08920 [Planctomycetes bacterium]|nr:hypothetical protein [Planctomycetota bacterium]